MQSPRRNRVTPTGEIVAVPERGEVYANRGVLHDREGTLVRDWQLVRWLACVLEFKGRRHPLAAPGRYTALFFLDEATALAAGHRPCKECRRAAFGRFAEAVALTHGDPAPPRAPVIDARLHADRIDVHGAKRTFAARLGDLPPATMVLDDTDARPQLVAPDALRPWTPGGYGAPRRLDPTARVTVLTPRVTVDAIRAGYVPAVSDRTAG